MKRIASALLAAMLVGASSAHADVSKRAAFPRAVIGTGISAHYNVASVTNPSTGTYLVTLTQTCSQALGIVSVNANRGDGICFGDFTAADAITVTCRNTSNTLANIPAGTIVQLVAYCAVP